ncbi:MAG: BspA family leucine-rich repeat surface protein, partial [Spirochaetota bacterium]
MLGKKFFNELFLSGIIILLFAACDLNKTDSKPTTNNFAPQNKAELKSLIDRLSHAKDLNHIDTKNIKDMSGLFQGMSKFNADISKWNTANVRNMAYMFDGAAKFNSDISGWNTSQVTDMTGM